MPTLTDLQLEAMWHRAMKADDRSMIDIIERALDGSEVDRRIAGMSARDVEIYAVAVAEVRS